MSLKVKVKVGNITHLSDARYCAGMGVSLLGFPVGSKGLDSTTYRQIIDWVSGPEYVLELTDANDLAEVKAKYPGHFIEIGKDDLALLNDATLQFIVRLDAADWNSVAPTLDNFRNIRYLEIEADVNQLNLVTMINELYPVLLRISNPSDLEAFLHAHTTGISLDGGSEERPGLRDYSDLAAILEQVED